MKPNPYSGFRLSPEEIARNKYLTPQTPQSPDVPDDKPLVFTKSGNLFLPEYHVSENLTYAQGMALIREDNAHPVVTTSDGRTLHRASTIREFIEVQTVIAEQIVAKNPQATPEDLEKLLKETDVFSSWFWTSTALAYRAKTTKFKITPALEGLVTLPQNSTDSFLNIPYSRAPGRELDSSKGIYNQGLTKIEFLSHEGWDELLEQDKDLKARYANIIYKLREKACAVYVRKNTETDEVRALYADDLSGSSYAGGVSYLIVSARFLRVDPNVAAAGGHKKK